MADRDADGMRDSASRDRGSVLHLLAPAAVGGLESVVESLAVGQTERGRDAVVAAVVEPSHGKHPFVRRLRKSGVEVCELKVPHRSYIAESRRVRGVLERIDPEVVHTHGYRADVLAATVARRGGWTTVSTVHGFTGGGWKNRVFEWLQRKSLARCAAVVAVSPPLGRELAESGIPREKLHVVPNAWSRSRPPLTRRQARERLSLPSDAFVVGWVGRLSHEKGPDVFLRAVARLEGNDLVASLIGDGALSAEVEALIERLDLRRSVRLRGEVPRAATLYRAFDVFVISSRTEGTPVSLFEAMDAGVPLVVTAVGGIPDVVSDSEALLVPPDDPASLAAAVRKVREHPDRAERRQERARQRLHEAFAPGPWLEEYCEIYRNALARSGKDRR